MTTSFNTPDTTQRSGALAPSPAAQERMLTEALAQAAAREKLAVLTPRGARRVRALIALRTFAETLATEGEQAARMVLTDVPAEPRGDAPAVAHVIGVAMSMLDEWFADPQLQRTLAVVPAHPWSNRQVRAMAGDVMGLARRGRAFGALDGLRRRHGGPTILEAAALSVASVTTAWAGYDRVALATALDRAMPDALSTAIDEQVAAAPDGRSFRQPTGVRRAPARSATLAAPSTERFSTDALTHEFEGWLERQTAMAAPSVADEMEMFGGLLALGRVHQLDLGQPEHIAPFISVLQKAADAERPEATHNALATLRDYTHFRLALGADGSQWRAVRSAITVALNGGTAAFATVARALAEEDELTLGERRAAFAHLALIARIDALLEWVGRSKEVTEAGALRASDLDRVAETLGLTVAAGEGAATFTGALVQAWWTALSHAGIVEVGASRARRGVNASEWIPDETLPLDLAVRVVSIFVAEIMARQGRPAEALAGLLQVFAPLGESEPAPAVTEPALRHLAEAGLVARDAEGRWSVPVVVRGAVARGILLAMEILAAGVESSDQQA